MEAARQTARVTSYPHFLPSPKGMRFFIRFFSPFAARSPGCEGGLGIGDDATSLDLKGEMCGGLASSGKKEMDTIKKWDSIIIPTKRNLVCKYLKKTVDPTHPSVCTSGVSKFPSLLVYPPSHKKEDKRLRATSPPPKKRGGRHLPPKMKKKPGKRLGCVRRQQSSFFGDLPSKRGGGYG